MIVSRLLNNLAGSHDASWKRRRGAIGGEGPKRGKVSQAPFGMALPPPLPPSPPILRAKWQFMLQLRMPTLHDVEVKKYRQLRCKHFCCTYKRVLPESLDRNARILHASYCI